MGITTKTIEAIKKQSFGRATGMVHRLAAEIEKQLHTIADLQAELKAAAADAQERDVARPDAERVLVCLQGDGLVEVWAEPWVHVRVTHLPDMRYQRNAEVAEEIILSRLPKVFRDLMDSRPPAAAGNFRCCPTYSSLRLAAIAVEEVALAKSIAEACQANAASA